MHQFLDVQHDACIDLPVDYSTVSNEHNASAGKVQIDIDRLLKLVEIDVNEYPSIRSNTARGIPGA